MAIRFQCPTPGCGKQLQAREDMEGKNAKCPGCGKAVMVPFALPDSPPPEPNRPAPLPEALTPADDSKSCPGCQATLATRAVICIECGYDFRTGKRIEKVTTSSPPPKRTRKSTLSCPICNAPFALGETVCRTCSRASRTLTESQRPSSQVLEVIRCYEVVGNLPSLAELEREKREAEGVGNKKGNSKVLGGVLGLVNAVVTDVNPLVGIFTGVYGSSLSKTQAAEVAASATEKLDRKKSALAVLRRQGLPELPAALIPVFSRQLRDAEVQSLVRHLRHKESAEMRTAAAAGLGLLGWKAKSAQPALLEMIVEPENVSRTTIVRALVAIVRDLVTAENEKAVADLAKALEDGRAAIRLAAVEVLERLGTVAEEVTALLQCTLTDEDEAVRSAAQAALNRIASGEALSDPAETTSECPKCGFKYQWDGAHCGHCGFVA